MSINGSRIEDSRRENLGYSPSPHSFPFGPWFLAVTLSFHDYRSGWMSPCPSMSPALLYPSNTVGFLFFLALGQEITFFSCYSLDAATFLFGSLHPGHNSVSCLWLKSLGFESDSCVTDTACNSNQIHYVTHLVVKTLSLDIEIRWKT